MITNLLTDRDQLALETRELLDRAQGADEDERRRICDEVVVNHLWLARDVALRFRRTKEDFDDLRQVACMGLVEAFNRYDPARGSFAGFAYLTCLGVVRKHLRDRIWTVRPPRQLAETIVLVRREAPDLSQRLGRTATAADLAEALGQPYSLICEALAARHCYDGLTYDGVVDAEPHDVEGEQSRTDTRVMIRGAVSRLNDNDRDLVRRRFYLEQSQPEIARALGMSQMTVSRRLTKVLTTLRTEIGEDDEPWMNLSAAC